MTIDLEPDLDPLRPVGDLAAALDAILNELRPVADLDERRRKAGVLLASLENLLDGAGAAYARVAAVNLIPDPADAMTPVSLSWTSGPGRVATLEVTWP